MAHRLSKIERLDWAASAIPLQWLYTWSPNPYRVAPLIVLFNGALSPGYWVGVIALGAAASLIWYGSFEVWGLWAFHDWAIAIILGVAVVLAVMLWRRQRHMILAQAFSCILLGILTPFIYPQHKPTLFDWGIHLLSSLVVFYLAMWSFKYGMQLASVYGEGWEEERAQVDLWLVQLYRQGKDDDVLEFKERNFLRGNRTYRILNAHDCWAVAAFRTGKKDDLPIYYRVQVPSAITLMHEPGGSLSAVVDGRIITSR